MKIRYEKFVLDAEEGITFEVTEGTNGELLIRALKLDTVNSYSRDYEKPPVPNGYNRLMGQWNTGFVIERVKDGSQFTWIPVGILESDGTLDKSFCEKFGRRNYPENCYETLSKELLEQHESVKKYGGFYISRYHIAKSKDRAPGSVPVGKAWTYIDFNEASKFAASFENNEGVTSHLLFGAEYDSAKKFVEKFGNCFEEKNAPEEEWTQERKNGTSRVIRKGNTFSDERDCCSTDEYSANLGFRIALCIK